MLPPGSRRSRKGSETMGGWFGWDGKIAATCMLVIYVAAVDFLSRWLQIEAFQTRYWHRAAHVMFLLALITGVSIRPSISSDAVAWTFVVWGGMMTITVFAQACLSYIVNGW